LFDVLSENAKTADELNTFRIDFILNE